VALPQRNVRAELWDALPPLPQVALRVIQVAQDPRSSAADLAVAVSSDPALAARILRAANSPLFRANREITSVQEALVRLGFVQARNIAVSSAITAAYAPDARNALFRIEDFWRHSLAVALKTSELAGRRQGGDVPSAFTAGLLHDIGRLALFYADPAAVDQAVAHALAEDIPLDALEGDALGVTHDDVGGRLAARWGLPPATVAAIADHHRPPGSGLTALVAEADEWCVTHGFLPGYRKPGPPGTKLARAAEAERLARQVDQLIELVTSGGVGIRR
jgi:putative nucleotidyltransferase with HDIG domain